MVTIFSVELNVGKPDCGVKLKEAPEGSPKQLHPTDCVIPLASVAVAV